MPPLFHSRASRVRSVDLARQNGCRDPYIDPAGARIRLQETFGSIPGLHHPVERRRAKATRPPGRLVTARQAIRLTPPDVHGTFSCA